MHRFEDRGLTLRLFKDEHDAKINGGALTVAQYGPGVIGQDDRGAWLDAHGTLPFNWRPDKKLLSIPRQHGFYVDESGALCCADVPPPGCDFQFQDKSADGRSWVEVWIVSQKSHEVLSEFVLWPSLDSLKQAVASPKSKTNSP